MRPRSVADREMPNPIYYVVLKTVYFSNNKFQDYETDIVTFFILFNS